MRCLWIGTRSTTVLLSENELYFTEPKIALTLNGAPAGEAETAVISLFGLAPATRYALTASREGKEPETLAFTTAAESGALDVCAFGAKGDGETDDTAALQAAILCCPEHGCVRVPPGTYHTGPLFLKSRLSLEIAEGATLVLSTSRAAHPVLPALIPGADGTQRPLGTWEGESRPMYAALLNGVDVTDVAVFGQGVLDGGGREGGWWADPKRADGPRRPRMVFLSHCRNVTLQGLTVRNSPAWNLHPHHSDDLRFLNLTVLAPSDSPNTDGFDPESCADVLAAGVRFSVGDDCIAVKAGKRAMAERFPKPCERVEIAHCLMENGHGGVTVGSEMSGGVRDVTVHHCLMRDTDRGLRIKTRRGRGGAVDGVTLRCVRMERVGAPFTLNGFYFCDADGHSPAVQNRAALPVDAGTPRLGAFTMADVEATDCAACACRALGLPESRIGSLAISDSRFAFWPDAAPFTPVMADGVEPCAGEGLDLTHVGRLTLRNVRLSGLRGEALRLTDVTEVDGRVETE